MLRKMKKMMRRPYLNLPLLLAFLLRAVSSDNQPSKVFIVYLGGHSADATAQQAHESHHSFLLSVKDSNERARESLLYSYTNSINGFAAFMSEEEAAIISKMKGVISVFRSEGRSSPHTTRSWDFMGFEEGLSGNENNLFAEKAKHGDGVIIGMLDSGIWPESKSFDDRGMGPVPKRWKGACEEGDAFTSSNCNRSSLLQLKP